MKRRYNFGVFSKKWLQITILSDNLLKKYGFFTLSKIHMIVRVYDLGLFCKYCSSEEDEKSILIQLEKEYYMYTPYIITITKQTNGTKNCILQNL